jgi:EmrB/QacA subfamily drug resistance transporter
MTSTTSLPGADPADIKPASSASGALSHRQIMTILSGLMMGMFLASLDQTIVSTAIRTISDDLNGLSQQAWVTTAYLITSTISTPLYGKLSDIYGRKPFYLAAISIFVAGSAACTFSTSMAELAAFRAFQGLGAGGLMSLALAIIGDIVPPRQRANYQGYLLAVFATSSVVGPLVGGFLAGQGSIASIAGWRWVFLVNVPIGVIALFVVARVLNVPHRRRAHRIDWWGALTITIGVVPLLVVAEQGREWGWGSVRSISCYAVGAVGLLVWVFVERAMGEAALIPMRLFRNPVFSKTSALSVLIGMGMFGGLMLIPQYLQIVKGASPTKSGLMMLPLMLGMMLASIVSGRITGHTGRYKIFPVLGTLLMFAAMLLFHFRVHWDTPLRETMAFMALLGLGLGCCMQTLILAVQNAVDPKDMGVASASSTFFRQMGGTAGTAVFLTILFSTVGDKISDAFRAAARTPSFQAALHDPSVVSDPANKPVLTMLSGGGSSSSTDVLSDSSFIQHLDARLAQPFKQGFAESMNLVFLFGAAVVVLAFLLVLWTKEVPLRNLSGIDARREAESQAGTQAEAVAGSAACEYEMRLGPGARISGTIRAAATGTPVGDVRVTLLSATGEVLATATTGPDGAYAFSDLDHGDYTVVASGYPPVAHPLRLPQSGLQAHDVELGHDLN